MEVGCVRAQPALSSRIDEAASCGPPSPGTGPGPGPGPGPLQDPEDVYETLPATVSVSTHMMAGSLAGIMEHSIMFPIDSVKFICQELLVKV
ncbi:mitoferrin-1-like isoform X2 [Rhincodon typus]|uniref:mitoferrin-1-like isoform X2 n=1 Tax=Rhincodon typus TaxID=259920 RepID=UPI002030206C|nr:mitoferrin-1-like isoform X2 [Rhincodon typus]